MVDSTDRKRLHKFYKFWNIFNDQTSRCKIAIGVARILISVVLFVVSVWKVLESDVGYETFFLVHEVSYYFTQILLTSVLLIKRKPVFNVFRDLHKSLGSFKADSLKDKAVKNYEKIVRRFEIVIIINIIFFCFSMTPLLSPAMSPIFMDDDSSWVILSSTWIPKILNCQASLVILYIISLPIYVIGVSHCLCYVMTLINATLHVRLQITLLVADLAAVRDRIEQIGDKIVAKALASSSISFCDLCLLDSNWSTTVGSQRRHGNQSSSTLWTSQQRDCCIESYRKVVIEACHRRFLSKAVQKHVDIKEKVRQLNDVNSPVAAIFQQTMILYAIAPNLSLVKDFASLDFVNYCIQQLAGLGILAILSFCGQIILNESERLQLAIYSCGWEAKPIAARRTILTMSTVANKPLTLAVGGMFTLGMASFNRALGALYSYLSFLQSLRIDKN